MTFMLIECSKRALLVLTAVELFTVARDQLHCYLSLFSHNLRISSCNCMPDLPQ